MHIIIRRELLFSADNFFREDTITSSRSMFGRGFPFCQSLENKVIRLNRIKIVTTYHARDMLAKTNNIRIIF